MTVKYQTLPCRSAARTPCGPGLGLDVVLEAGDLGQRPLLLVGQEGRLLRGVGQQEVGGDAGGDGQQTLDEEHQLPALDPAQVVTEADQPAGQRPADHLGERLGQVEDREQPDPHLVREPGREVEDHAREQAGLGHAEQEAERDEGGLALHEGEARRDHAPGDGDPGQPHLGPEAAQREVAGDLEDRVADEEDAGPQRERPGADPAVGLQPALGEADVGAVQEGDDVEDHQHRHQPPGRLGDRGLQDG